jgi:hypothetical protein
LSGEHEAKKLLQSKVQIRTAVFWGLQAFHEFKFSPSRQDLSKNRCKPGLQSEKAVFWCSVLAAPGSRAAVSLSYLAAKAKSKCWKVIVNLVFLALGQLSTPTLSLAIVRGDNPL